MAVRLKRKVVDMGEISLASIPDIVFLLLIFFMVATVFNQEQGLPIILPAANNKTQDIKVKQSNVCTIEIDRNNILTLDGKPIEVNGLKNALVKRLKENPKLIVVLSTHPEADYGMMVAAFDEIRLADARRVSLKTIKG